MIRMLGIYLSIDDIKKELSTHTIFNKIEFSNITKESLKTKLEDLRNRQVPNREVLLHMEDEDVVFLWFKNWLHPSLKHCVVKSPKNKLGVSKKVIQDDCARDMLNFYENGQQNFNYSLQEVDDYIGDIQ